MTGRHPDNLDRLELRDKDGNGLDNYNDSQDLIVKESELVK